MENFVVFFCFILFVFVFKLLSDTYKSVRYAQLFDRVDDYEDRSEIFKGT
jgi:hypothetical protein